MNRLLQLYNKHFLRIHLVLLIAASFSIFSNNYQHEYLLDSSATIEENPYLRDLKFIPRYFTDATILSVNKANSDYRPLLQTSFALNYWISGYDTWSWHLVQILLHSLCVWGLYLITRHLLEKFESSQSPILRQHLPFLIALTFAIHPINSGVINYIYARSSLLTSTFLIYSIFFYLQTVSLPQSAIRIKNLFYGFSLAMFTAALFTKVEAVAGIAVFVFAEILETAHSRMSQLSTNNRSPVSPTLWRDLRTSFRVDVFSRLTPFLKITAIYLLIWLKLVPDVVAITRQQDGMTTWTYLLTQITAGWYYIFNWFVPHRLIAHNEVYPIFNSAWQPLVLLAVAGWLTVLGLFSVSYAKRPYLFF